MAVLEEELARLKQATKEANEKMADFSKSSEESIRQAQVLRHNTVAEDEKQGNLEEDHEKFTASEKESS